jgi:hypothetical protein
MPSAATLARPRLRYLGLTALVVAALVAAGGRVAGQERAKAEAAGEEPPPRIEQTQVAISKQDGRQQARFRATVVAKAKDGLTLLTAGHCLGPDDVGRTVRVGRGDGGLDARVVRVVRNPYYRPAATGDVPGADNAVVVLRVDPKGDRQAALLRDLRPVELVDRPLPDPAGQVVPAHTIDQFDREHVVRGGNYSNPRWLEWGPDFFPVPGDSGSGLFVARRTRSGRPRPLLIGVVVVRSDRGGGGSLFSRNDRWLVEALAEPARDRP